MKSALELAMEKLDKEDPIESLTTEQKAEIAELESKFKAKLAEREIFLQKPLQEAEAKHDFASVEELKKQLRNEKQMIEEDLELAKSKVREGK